MMTFCFKSSHLVGSISVMTLASGLTLSPLSAQKSLAQTVINGAGSTFIAPLVTGSGSWFDVYGAPAPAVNPNVRFNYAAVGSGCGRTAFLTQRQPARPTPCPSNVPAISLPISFGASDAPLTSAQRTVTGSPNAGPPVQVPVVAGAVALPYNSSLGSGLRLTRSTYCGIFGGQIRSLNGRALTVVVRADSSGTTFNLTNHLNTACATTQYRWTRGVGTTVSWPSNFVQVTGGSALIARVKSTAGAIGYADVSAARTAGVPTATLQNKSGNYVAPTSAATTAALTGAVDTDSTPNIISLNVPDPSGTAAYPIVGVTYFLFYDRYSNSAVATGIRGFINWAEGTNQADSIAIGRNYAPLPAALKTATRNVVNTYVDNAPGR